MHFVTPLKKTTLSSPNIKEIIAHAQTHKVLSCNLLESVHSLKSFRASFRHWTTVREGDHPPNSSCRLTLLDPLPLEMGKEWTYLWPASIEPTMLATGYRVVGGDGTDSSRPMYVCVGVNDIGCGLQCW